MARLALFAIWSVSACGGFEELSLNPRENAPTAANAGVTGMAGRETGQGGAGAGAAMPAGNGGSPAGAGAAAVGGSGGTDGGAMSGRPGTAASSGEGGTPSGEGGAAAAGADQAGGAPSHGGCTTNDTCDGGLCDIATGDCVECLTSADCSSSADVCDALTGRCTTACTEASMCTGDGLSYCAPRGVCVACVGDDDCERGFGCDASTNLCRECRSDADCDSGMHCDGVLCRPL